MTNIDYKLILVDWVPKTWKIISRIIPMFDLTVQVIEEAMNYLKKGGKNMYTTVQQFKGLNYKNLKNFD